MDLHRMASFPFLTESIAYLKTHQDEFASIPELASDITYERVREMAMDRVNHILERQELPVDFHSPVECREEVLSYILCRILVAAAGDQHLIRWYALAEAVRATKLMADRPLSDVVMIAEDVGLHADLRDEDHAGIGFVPYITFGSSLKSPEWKLANQNLRNGRVSLTRDRFVRLLREVMKEKFERDVSAMTVPEAVAGLFGTQLEEILGVTRRIRDHSEARMARVVLPSRFPPCIHHLLQMTRDGENVPHSGRFAMTSFLLTTGMGVDEIVRIFKVSPDFREDLARYQVEHIHGDISGTGYDTMACRTMVTYGLCPGKDRLCERISHPMGYYEARNDDALPPEERLIRRALAAAHEISRTLKVPLRTIQSPLQNWFRETAIIDLPGAPAGGVEQGEGGSGDSVTAGADSDTGSSAEVGGANFGSPSGGGAEDTGGAGGEKGLAAGTRVGAVNGGGTDDACGGAAGHGQGNSDPPTGDRSSTRTGAVDGGDAATTVPGGGKEAVPGQSPGNEASPSPLSPSPLSPSPLSPSTPPEFIRFRSVFDADDGVPGRFMLSVAYAGLRRVKAIHPGSMEAIHFVGTSCLLEDRTRRTIRVLPVLDFDLGQIIRDFQKTGRELEFLGQVVVMNEKRFLHVVGIHVPG